MDMHTQSGNKVIFTLIYFISGLNFGAVTYYYYDDDDDDDYYYYHNYYCICYFCFYYYHNFNLLWFWIFFAKQVPRQDCILPWSASWTGTPIPARHRTGVGRWRRRAMPAPGPAERRRRIRRIWWGGSMRRSGRRSGSPWSYTSLMVRTIDLWIN